MARQRTPQLPAIETDPAVWGRFAACADRDDLDWFDPEDDAADDDLDLSLLDDEARQILEAMNARIDNASSHQASMSDPIKDLFADELSSELDLLADQMTAPGGVDDGDDWDADPALRLCAACPVAAHCLEWALEWNLDTGILGGLTPDQREAIRRQRQLPKHDTRTGYSVHNCHCPLCTEAARVAAADRRNPLVAA